MSDHRFKHYRAHSRSTKISKDLPTAINRRKYRKEKKAQRKALYLSTLPKNKIKRLLYRIKPGHLFHYWFSLEGLIMSLKLFSIFVVLGFIVTLGLFAYYRRELPQLKDISGDNIGGSVSYYDRTGKILLFEDYSGIKRIPVQSNQISNYMKEATVAIEDKNFYTEGAFDIRGIIRAAFHDIFNRGGVLEGGSTITQQVVKLNENWTNNRTITRKIKELILAVEVAREYTKSQILTGYLNIAPYGGIDYGVQSAAQDYFHENASQLDLAQSALLAAMPQSPALYSPYGSTRFNPAAGNTFNAQALLGRQHYILNLMVSQHLISASQANAAKKENVLNEIHPMQGKYTNIKAPYFVLVAKQQLENQLGSQVVSRGGLKVITTLSMPLQKYAETDVANNYNNVVSDNGDEEAIVAESVKTGQIVALVGGVNFNNPAYGQINYANINVSPGSSVKPAVYGTFINNNTNVGAGSVLYDVQQPIMNYYPCTNKALPLYGGNCLWDYDFKYPGPETLRYALGGSRNVPAIKTVLSEVPNDTSNGHIDSINKFISTFNSMMDVKDGYTCYQPNVNVETAGPNQQTQCYASAGIGDGAYIHIDNQVNMDATLARLGQAIPETYILKVTDASGKTLYKWTQPKPYQAIRTDAAYIIDNILSDPRASYLPGYCTATNCTPLSSFGYKFQRYNGWDIAIKTGTTNYGFDGLMTAWNTQYAVVSWVGYHTRNRPLKAGQMEYLTEPLTRTFMTQALSALNEKPINWVQPSDIKVLPAYVQRTHIDFGDQEPGPTMELFPSWYQGKNSGITSETIDKVSGLLATSCTPNLAKEVISGANDSSFSVDIFYPKFVGNEQNLSGTSLLRTISTSQTDNVHNCNDSPPKITVTVSSTTGSPSSACIGSCTITVAASQGTHPLSGGSYQTSPAGTVQILLNGSQIVAIKIPTTSSSNFNYSFLYKPTSSGSGTITANVIDSVLYEGSSSTSINYAP
ncbi:MAG: transglycosylase domain-containing protein [Patescibacteria group bacterium]|nr:transglycosylase domain-containing protein [Patescibacteria group bacterium]